MQSNIAIQSAGRIAWSGTAAAAIDIRRHNVFAFSFYVTADIAADTTFVVQAAPVDPADNCTPGAFADIPELTICDRVENPGVQSIFTIPAGTLAGTCLAGTIPCRSGAFIRLAAGAGQTADVQVVMILHGPHMGGNQDPYN